MRPGPSHPVPWGPGPGEGVPKRPGMPLPGPPPPLKSGVDIHKLGKKLGGQISITSSESSGANRRPPMPMPMAIPMSLAGNVQQMYRPEMSPQLPSQQNFRPDMGVGGLVPGRGASSQDRQPVQPMPTPVEVKEEPADLHEEEFLDDEEMEDEEDFGAGEEEDLDEGEFDDDLENVGDHHM